MSKVKAIKPNRDSRKIIKKFTEQTGGWFTESDIKTGDDRQDYVSLLNKDEVVYFSKFTPDILTKLSDKTTERDNIETLSAECYGEIMEQFKQYYQLILNTEKRIYKEQVLTMKNQNTMTNEDIVHLIERLDAFSYLFEKQILIYNQIDADTAPAANQKTVVQTQHALNYLLEMLENKSWLMALLFNPVDLQSINHSLALAQAQISISAGIPDSWIRQNMRLSKKQMNEAGFVR